MRKLLLAFLGFFFLVAFSDVKAQSTTASAKGKDEYWGTSKAPARGTGADAVGQRASNLDKRFNEYETGKRSRFEKSRIANSKRMKAIEKKEKKMLKKHKRDKRMLERKKRQRN